MRATVISTFLGLTFLFSNSAYSQNPSVSVDRFGTLPGGQPVQEFRLSNRTGAHVKIMEWGATITELSVPDRQGNFGNVVLGSRSLDDYVKQGFPAASVIGRYANRIRNARFELDGETIYVTKNAGDNHIHGGRAHFGKVLWKGTIVEDTDGPAVEFEYTSRDGEEGFPGTLQVKAIYHWNDRNELEIRYRAKTDKPTVINLTNHAYFNLTGPGTDVLNYQLQIEADEYTQVDSSLIPTGTLSSLDNSPLDFRKSTRIGERIEKLYEAARGYDHNYVLRGDAGKLKTAAKVFDSTSGRAMECLTTEPGVQLYTANGFNKNPFPKHAALCLETQHFPDSPNHSHFPSVVIRPDQSWSSTTIYRFTIAQTRGPN